MRTLIAAGAAFLTLIAVGSSTASEPGATLHFPHVVHAENDVACVDCHARAETSTWGFDSLLPSKDTCADCHDVEDEAECGVCHVNADDPEGYVEKAGVAKKFPHASHVGAGMDCGSCHGDIAVAEPIMPSKPLCRSCHETVSGFSDCRLCHAGDEELRPASHTPGYESFHELDAAMDQTDCAGCHTQTDCQDCHSGDNVRPRTHDLSFAFDHALEARSNEAQCASCHGEPEYCSSCHAAEQILPRDHSRADWVIGSGGRHAEEGRYSIETCVACHDEGESAPICAECHGR